MNTLKHGCEEDEVCWVVDSASFVEEEDYKKITGLIRWRSGKGVPCGES